MQEGNTEIDDESEQMRSLTSGHELKRAITSLLIQNALACVSVPDMDNSDVISEECTLIWAFNEKPKFVHVNVDVKKVNVIDFGLF